MLPLFPEPDGFDRAALAAKLDALSRENIFIGTSSWKYEGWLGQVYSRERYLTRGKFSQKAFESRCLGEYAETFPVVCGDFSFYQFPTAEFWHKLFATAGPRLRFAFKVPEEVTVREFPSHPRYGPRAGQRNDSFLNPELFREMFLRPLGAFQTQVAVLIFEFGTFNKRCYENVEGFVRDLGPFLASLPAGWRYAVEVRNPEFLAPEYFGCLRERGAAHVFNAWTRMPNLGRQMAIGAAYTADFTVTRALLSRGRPYEDAVRTFTPYDRIQEENPRAREAMREEIRKARERRRAAYIFVNNRLEGNAPLTIEAIIDD